jgi:hypothetical protein
MKNLIRKILKESIDDFDWVEGVKKITPPEQFLYDLMSNLKMMESKKMENWVLYKNENGVTLMVDNINGGTGYPALYVDYYQIWEKLEDYGLKREEIKDLCVRMLEATHKRKVLTADFGRLSTSNDWK